MKKFIARRAGTMVLVLLAVSMLTYSFIFLAPGDPARAILRQYGIDSPSEAQLEQFREAHGLNDPLPIRYGRWLWNALHGDFGDSYFRDTDVTTLIVDRIPQTAELSLAGLLIGLLIAFPAGIISAIHQGQITDYGTQVGSLLGVSMPNFWLGYLLIIIFSIQLNLFPVSGAGGLKHLVLPAVVLGTGMAATLTRLLRASMLEVLDEDYIRTARSKGLPERIVVYKHAVRNALLPILTVVGLSFATLLNGTLIVEVIFQRPGLGQLFVNALFNRDYPIVMANVLITAASFVVANTAVDVLYRYIDPRIDLENSQP